MTFNPDTASAEDPEATAVSDAAVRLIKNLTHLTADERAALDAGLASVKGTAMAMPAHGLEIGAVWDSLQDLIRAIATVSGDPRG